MSDFPWPLPILTWGHLLSKLPTDPSPRPHIFSNPPCLCSHHASSWVFYLPSPKLTLGEHRVLMQEFLSFFFKILSHTPLPWGLGRQKCLVPDRCPALWKSVLHCTSESICGLPCLPLWITHSQQPQSQP